MPIFFSPPPIHSVGSFSITPAEAIGMAIGGTALIVPFVVSMLCSMMAEKEWKTKHGVEFIAEFGVVLSVIWMLALLWLWLLLPLVLFLAGEK